MKPILTVGLALLFATSIHAAEKPPNILLIVADDLGYSDLGCYGGEIATPNLDELAKTGLQFGQFYNTGRCWPSRAAILTGYYAQQVNRDGFPGQKGGGAAGVRPAWGKLLPEMLRPLGYRTYHSGKWHVDGKPLQNGFDRSYSLDDHDRHFTPKKHTLDDQPLPPVKPDAGYYSSTFIASHAIECLKEHAEKFAEKPSFSFVAFTAPHFPLQAPQADIERYRKKYLKGWDALREARWRRLKALKLAGQNLSTVEREVGSPYPNNKVLDLLGPNEVNVPKPWGELTTEQRAFQADKMAVHAAMVDRMDKEIGRILAELKRTGRQENTLIMFLSDNGASAEMMVRGDGHDQHAECGIGATFLSLGAGWSGMANTPFRRHKTWVHEGGISTPFIVHWPAGFSAKAEVRHAPAHVVDLVPTILEVASGKPVDKAALQAGDKAPVPIPGVSLVPLFAKDAVPNREPIWWLHEGNRALRQGNWKIVSAVKPKELGGDWELYDLSTDRSEGTNLAATHPEKVRELAKTWTRMRDEFMKQAK